MRHDKLEKEMNLMLLLTENHRYEVDAICDRIGISRRMLYYYLESFRDWGFKVEKNGKIYSLDRESPFFKHLFETINFTEEEALTMLSILNKVEDNNAIIQRLRRKLDRFYDLNILSNPQLREQAAHHVSVLYDAIKRHRLVKIMNYSSPHSKSMSDRVVEPFLMMNNNNDVRCYELSSKMNKTFKVARMGDVILLDLEIQEDEASIIRHIFDRYLAGVSMENIAKEITALGCPTRDGTQYWQLTSIQYILQNEKYAGDSLSQKKYTTRSFPRQ